MKTTVCLLALIVSAAFTFTNQLRGSDDPGPIVSSLQKKVRALQDHFGPNPSGDAASKLETLSRQLQELELLAGKVRDAQSKLESLKSKLKFATSDLESAMRAVENAKNQFMAKKNQLLAAAQSQNQRAVDHNNRNRQFRVPEEQSQLNAYNAEKAALENEAQGIIQQANQLGATEGKMLEDAQAIAAKKAQAVQAADTELSKKENAYSTIAEQFNAAAVQTTASVNEFASVAGNQSNANSNDAQLRKLTPFERGAPQSNPDGNAAVAQSGTNVPAGALTEATSINETSKEAANAPIRASKFGAASGFDDGGRRVSPVTASMPQTSQVPPAVAKDPGYQKLQKHYDDLSQNLQKNQDRLAYIEKNPKEAKPGELGQLVQVVSKDSGALQMDKFLMNTYRVDLPPPGSAKPPSRAEPPPPQH